MDYNKDSTFYNYPQRPLQSKQSAAPVSAEDNSNNILLLHISLLQQGLFFTTFQMCLRKT